MDMTEDTKMTFEPPSLDSRHPEHRSPVATSSQEVPQLCRVENTPEKVHDPSPEVLRTTMNSSSMQDATLLRPWSGRRSTCTHCGESQGRGSTR